MTRVKIISLITTPKYPPNDVDISQKKESN
jgi:hypothetical protein